jgi:hypothetical protein
VVDIAWGAACYMPADQSKEAGDFLLGADGVDSVEPPPAPRVDPAACQRLERLRANGSSGSVAGGAALPL